MLNLVATPGDTLVDLSWDAPTNASAAGVFEYVIAVDPPDAGPFTQAGTTLEVTGLTNDVGYTFTVNAVGTSGEGPPASADATPASSGFWHLATGLPPTYGIEDIAHDPVSGNFVAVGRDSLSVLPGNGVILTSPDNGHSWVDRSAANSALLAGFNVGAVLAGGSKIVAVANDGTGSFPNNSKILVSTDGGATWAAPTIPATPLGGTWGLSSVAYNGTVWFVHRGDNGTGRSFTMTSTDTVTWTAHTIGIGGIGPGPYVLAQGSTFVSIDSNGTSPCPVMSCTDAINWAEVDSSVLGDNNLNGNKQLASDGSILMAVGADNAFALGVNATSSDLGATWALGNIPTIDTWGPTVYDGTIWIATGSNNGATVSTPDRSTWTTQVASGTVVYPGVATDGAGHTVALGFDFNTNLAVAVYH